MKENKMSTKDLENLRVINGIISMSMAEINIAYDDEDAEIFDRVLTSKLEDLPNVLHDILEEKLEELPKEFRKIKVGTVLDIIMNLEETDA